MNPNRNIFNFSNIMSRRKQSHPKPLLKRDDEELEGDENASTQNTKHENSCKGEEEGAENKSPLRELKKSQTESNYDSDLESRPPSGKSGEKRPLEESSDLSPVSMLKILPTLRLNVALASDPASNPGAKEILSIKSENYKHTDDDDDDVDLINHNEDAETLLDSVNISKIVLNEQHNLAVPKTKENAENNLMAKNFDLMRPNVFMCTPCGIRFSSLSTLEAHATYYCSHRKIAENTLKGTSEVNGVEPPAKAMKTGKQYACSQCSYSADKKVSLNRHMRMHQSSPAASSTTSNGGDETQSQIVVPQIVAPVPQQALPIVDRYCSDCDIRFSSTKTYRAHKTHYCSSRHSQSQSSSSAVPTVLPTTTVTPKPPKSGSQSPPSEEVKTPPAPSQPFLALPTNPIIIIPYSLIRSASIIPGPLSSIAQGTNSESACFILQNGTLQPIAYTLSQVPSNLNTQSQSQQTTSRAAAAAISATQASINDSKKPSSSSSSSAEVLKAINKRDGLANRETSTPLDLSVRRISPINMNAARERSLSLSSAISDQFRMEFDTMMEGKENLSVSGDSVTPEQIVCAPSLPGSPPLTPSPKRRSNSPRGSTVSISPNSTSSSHPIALMRPLLPADIALRLSDPSLSTLNVISPLVKQSMEFALRNAVEATSAAQRVSVSPQQALTSPTTPTSIPPQVLVKTGMSKCKQCNIVFCKYENYVAHKKHYCSARNLEDSENGTKVSPPPANSTSIGVPQTYQQLICVACGVKFASRDNLNAHQAYYCLKRNENENSTSAAVATVYKEKCAKCKTFHDPSQVCVTIGGAYKCPICEVTSVSSAEARKHMETHGGIKAFRCTICRYKGNTLRGMRTHIRMHIDKKSGDFNEENYISCILEDSEIPPIAPINKSPPLERAASVNSEKISSPNVEEEIVTEDINENHSLIKKEPTDESLKDDNEEDETSLIPENIIQVKMEEIPDEVTTDTQKYCSGCDIVFTYENTLAAHKKFYCKGLKNERPASNGPSPNSNNVSIAATETTVL